MKLISMTDFVIEQMQIKQSTSEFKEVIAKYAKFLKQTLELWMFAPCDEDGNVVKEPMPNDYDMRADVGYNLYTEDLLEYERVKEKCLFNIELAFLKDNIYKENILNSNFKDIESILNYYVDNLIELTPTSIKRLGLSDN